MKETLYNSVPPGSASASVLANLRTHASRTMMLSELELLLDAVPGEASPEDYRRAVLEENVLLKTAVKTRDRSLRHLRELYLLDKQEPIFGALRVLWDYDPPSRPLLGLLAAVTRDGLLRATAGLISQVPAGTPVNAEMLSGAVATANPNILAPGILDKVGRNTASS